MVDPLTEQIALVRDFNRYYTRRIGILTDSYLGQARPLSEARLLFEIRDRADVRALRTRLGLDSGYLSRLLRSLTGQGLVRVRQHPEDGRVRVAELTDAGRRELADLDRRSDAGVAELLAPLTGEQRETMVEAQRQIRRLLRLAAVVIEAVDAGSAGAGRCLDAYATELAHRFPEGYDRAALVRPGELAGGAGAFLVASEDGRPVGCGVWRTLRPGVAEIRHLWVHADARGIGLGRRLLCRLETEAAASGAVRVCLGTHTALTEAAALYRSAGYRQTEPHGDSPYDQLGFEKIVADTG